jgi:hypothetical protein
MIEEKPNTNALSKPSSELLLRESRQATQEIDVLLFACASSQKLYGREPEAFEAATQVIQNVLGRFPADKSVRSLQTWLERSTEFPTPADLVNLIKRNGKPPLRESDIIAIRKKDGEDRTREEWAMLQEWDTERQEGWKDFPDPQKDAATLQENRRLRQEIATLKDEIGRLASMLQAERAARGAVPPEPSLADKVNRTIAEMRKSGASEIDIREFAAQCGMADAA